MPSAMTAIPAPIYYDSHMHTPLCKHAFGEPEEYAATGHAAGLKGIIFTCHSPMGDNFWPRVRMSPEEFPEYVALVARATAAFAADNFDVRLGMESDFFPGTEAWIEKLHASADFNHCLGSVHYFGPEYQNRFWLGDLDEFQRLYFEHIADSAETGLFDTLAHPDLIKTADPDAYDFDTLKENIARALDRVAATGVAMELNTSGIHKRYPEMNPGPGMLRLMAERNIPVVVGSDSHHPKRVAENFPTALELLKQAGYHNVSIFLDRKRQELPIDTVLASLHTTTT
ncbi:MAG: histidinol-phosphatase HisJ family protein [Verrucomicrobiales bacterium]|nr:histidinol-phosphatase HisJ family protein [Verrucomicrobiales bacterium]